MGRLAGLAVAGAALVGAAGAGCEGAKDGAEARVTYAETVAPLLAARCAACHGPGAAGAFHVGAWQGLLGCTSDGRPVLEAPGTASAPLVAVLDRDDHRGLLSPGERAALVSWVAAGAPASAGGGVHPARFADPRAPEGHAAALRGSRYAPMIDAAHPDACGVCHEGSPARPVPAPSPAPGATACTTCHSEPDGALACGTCHGSGARAYPPADPCFGGRDPGGDPHARHVGAAAGAVAGAGAGAACAGCHPVPSSGRLDGTHADGRVEVWFAGARAGADAGAGAAWDPATRTCTGTCHARGGARPVVSWGGEARVGCGDCHGAPPASHAGRFAGSCRSCHAEADARGEALTPGPLHLNGRVDVGDGTGRCGGCHGAGDDPWPRSGAHLAHAAPSAAAPVACTTCHEVPAAGAAHPSGRGRARVALAGLAVRGGARARYDEAKATCADTYCHAGRGAARPAPAWAPDASARACTACHGAPPPPPHPPSASGASCGDAGCHAGATLPAGGIAPAWSRVHVDGAVDRAAP